jgi:hypothetical protein
MRRRDVLDSRISQRSVQLFRMGKSMLARGVPTDAEEFSAVASELRRELKIRPWQPDIFDENLFEGKVDPEREDFVRVVRELYDLLDAAA